MTEDEIKKLSKGELIEKLIEVYSSPYYDVYTATKTQLLNLASEIKNAKIKFSDDDKTFDAFIKWGEKVEKITDSLESIMKKMNKDEIKRAEDEVKKTRHLSPEVFASRR